MREPEPYRDALAAWDFEHSKKRPKVYVGDRWHHQCQCGKTFLTMQEFYDHRIDMGVARLTRLTS